MTGTPTVALTSPRLPGRAPRFTASMWRRRTAVVGLAGLFIIVLVAITAPWIVPHPPGQTNLANVLAPPVWSGGDMTHILGTDGLGRDVLSRLIYGARSSVLISSSAMLIGGTLGVITGLIAGFFGGLVDTVIMRLGDIQLALPFILIAIVILGMLPERRPIHLIVVLGIPAWIVYARVIRARVLTERESDYVQAATTLGASGIRRIFRYILPQVWGVLPAIALVDLSNLVVMESTLSFLGFGLSSPDISWGQILADGRQSMAIAPWLSVLPGLAIMFTVLSINLAVEAPGLESRRRPWRAHFLRRPKSDSPSRTPSDSSPAPPATDEDVLLSVQNLAVDFQPHNDSPPVHAVRGIDLTVRRGQIAGIVGESGSGKSVTAYAISRLLPGAARIPHGSIHFDGIDLTAASERQLRQIRGRRIGMIFQNPTGSLNPVFTVGFQMVEAIRANQPMARKAARELAASALRDVGFGNPSDVLRRHPFRLSGGQNQRVMIAMTMVVEPELLLADEPTTALDVTTQAQVLDQLRRVRDEHGVSVVIISHDIGLIGEIADEVVVLYAGRVCESGTAEQVLLDPQHPYTQALLSSVPTPEVIAADSLEGIAGDLPDPMAPIHGCPFAPRCPFVMDVCRTNNPALLPVPAGQTVACHLHVPQPEVVPR
ncbi:dipeptide/oligopeptide/nickel ABC transporter permease/ATP-binding protein [Pseudactinotalea sp. Z1748]|uniref:dipeptide/oligopeptide/nickel ABC transporter permease/ATP-binding protein n=1 Tax=Pseudactinotalea sp. Z1748 TaxID=3413027 RepID=UPI003C7DCF9D